VLPRCLSGGGLIPNPGAVEGFPDVGSGGSTVEVDPTDPTGEFVDAVGDDIQITWEEQFAGGGRTYQPTQIVLFRGSTQTGCGLGTAETGPFYCPLDRRVYLDFSFFKELERRFGASGDFAEAYVIAHEIGHHVQTLLGISGQVQEASEQDPSRANELSIRQELQADCLAGVWASSANARGVLEPGDLEEGLDAASCRRRPIQAKVEEDRSETWTHGSAEQRSDGSRVPVGQPGRCDTSRSRPTRCSEVAFTDHRRVGRWQERRSRHEVRRRSRAGPTRGSGRSRWMRSMRPRTRPCPPSASGARRASPCSRSSGSRRRSARRAGSRSARSSTTRTANSPPRVPCQNLVTVRLADASIAGRMIRGPSSARRPGVRGPTWWIAPDNPARVEACRRAAVEARRKAEAYADALGLRLGGVVEVREPSPGGHAAPRPAVGAISMRAVAEPASVEVDPGELNVQAQVEVTFFLES
jgi:predicted metalloprotease